MGRTLTIEASRQHNKPSSTKRSRRFRYITHKQTKLTLCVTFSISLLLILPSQWYWGLSHLSTRSRLVKGRRMRTFLSFSLVSVVLLPTTSSMLMNPHRPRLGKFWRVHYWLMPSWMEAHQQTRNCSSLPWLSNEQEIPKSWRSMKFLRSM